MKAHVGVDSKSKLIHAVVATPANVADSRVLPDLLHGDETRVWGDQAYRGQGRVLEECAPRAQDFTCQQYRYKDRVDEVERAKNRTKAKVRSDRIKRIADRAGCWRSARRGRKTSPASSTVIRIGWMKWSARRTARRRRCGQIGSSVSRTGPGAGGVRAAGARLHLPAVPL